MTAWVVRAGSNGETQGLALEQGLISIGWSETGDLSGLDKHRIRKLLEQHHPDAAVKRLAVWTGELLSFVQAIVPGDLAVLPLKGRAAIALGRVTSGYVYRPDLEDVDAVHTHSVDWLRTDVPRTAFDQTLLNTLGSTLTVFRAERNNAAAQLEAALGSGPPSETVVSQPPIIDAASSQLSDESLDLERRARDAIVSLVHARFRARDLERLVEAILIAEGFHVDRTRAGADGGVDILAGRGAHGFDSPRICVQVKSGKAPEGVKTVRELQGALKNFGAEHGLFVSWSGYTSAVYAEARRSFFQVRLWNSDDLVDALLGNYDALPAEVRAELPLKRIWAPAAPDGDLG
jgi:restriction system protein